MTLLVYGTFTMNASSHAAKVTFHGYQTSHSTPGNAMKTIIGLRVWVKIQGC